MLFRFLGQAAAEAWRQLARQLVGGDAFLFCRQALLFLSLVKIWKDFQHSKKAFLEK